MIEYGIDGAPAQRAELKRVVGWGAWPKMIDPSDGSEVPLLLDRKSGKVRFDVNNPAIKFNRSALKRQADAEFDEALKG